MAIGIDEINRAMVLRDMECKKEALNGQLKVILTYNAGQLTKATMERIGPLFPGVGAPAAGFPKHDQPGINRG